MKHTYYPKGVCPMQLDFDLDGDVVTNIQFQGGCNGNLKGIGRLVEGLPVDEVISRLEGIPCGMKSTSCPDQLATALKKVMAKRNANA